MIQKVEAKRRKIDKTLKNLVGVSSPTGQLQQQQPDAGRQSARNRVAPAHLRRVVFCSCVLVFLLCVFLLFTPTCIVLTLSILILFKTNLGSFMSTTQAIVCKTCPAGRYGDVTALECASFCVKQCKGCVTGRYSAEKGVKADTAWQELVVFPRSKCLASFGSGRCALLG